MELPETGLDLYVRSRELAQLAERFDPIGLKEMDSLALLNRTDIKFVMTFNQLIMTLVALQSDYSILSVGGQRLNHYRTLYFDTPDFYLYHRHVNGAADRYKVRSREYADSHRSYLEVKHKVHNARTIKTRIRTNQPVTFIDMEVADWLDSVFPYDSRSMEPKLWNTFTRITLVSMCSGERITLDTNLKFYAGGEVVQLGGVAVAEIKMDTVNHNSVFLMQMRNQHLRPQGFSKYCLGVSLLYEQVKRNAMKSKILKIEKMGEGAILNERAYQIFA